MYKRFVVTLILASVLSLGGCNTPSLTASVGRADLQTDGAILVSGSNFSPNHTYGIGIFTNSTPRKIGTVTTDGGGNINNVKLEYSCVTLLTVVFSVEVYELNGNDLGAGIAQTKTDRATCF